MTGIVDSQVHLFSPDAAALAATRGHQIRSAEELLAEMDTRPAYARCFLVPPGSSSNETCQLARKRWPDRFQVMGVLALDKTAARTTVASWADSKMAGLRLRFPPGAEPSWLSDGTADWFWPAAEAAGIPVMVWAPRQLHEIGVVARRHPSLKVIIDHLGLHVTDRGRDVQRGVDDLLGLADESNVAVKASALPNHSLEAYPYRDLHDPIRSVVHAFGAERVFWGSDLTRLTSSYTQARDLFTDAIGLTSDEVALVMGEAIDQWIQWESFEHSSRASSTSENAHKDN